MIIVKYSCEQCGLKHRDVIVPERDPADDALKYVRDIVGDCVAADHAMVSPHCRATHIQELMIPIDPSNPNAPVGMKPSTKK